MLRPLYTHYLTSANHSSVGMATPISQTNRLRAEVTCASSHGQKVVAGPILQPNLLNPKKILNIYTEDNLGFEHWVFQLPAV